MHSFAQKQRTPAASAATFVPRAAGVGAILRSPARVQAKLTIGAPDDPLEHEADRVADQVMRMPEPGGLQIQSPSSTAIRRKCAACEDEATELPAAHERAQRAVFQASD